MAFGLPNFGQITEAFKKAQQIQQDAQKLQEELEAMEILGKNNEGNATVWLSGNQEPLRVQIEQDLIEKGQKAIEEGILEAMKNAHEISTKTMKERMEELTGGLNLNLPGITNEN
mgnify:CR=1 FL=1